MHNLWMPQARAAGPMSKVNIVYRNSKSASPPERVATRFVGIPRFADMCRSGEETGYVTHRDESFATPCIWDLAIRLPSERVPQHPIKKLIS